jgi:hypothetical protein
MNTTKITAEQETRIFEIVAENLPAFLATRKIVEMLENGSD